MLPDLTPDFEALESVTENRFELATSDFAAELIKSTGMIRSGARIPGCWLQLRLSRTCDPFLPCSTSLNSTPAPSTVDFFVDDDVDNVVLIHSRLLLKKLLIFGFRLVLRKALNAGQHATVIADVSSQVKRNWLQRPALPPTMKQTIK